jgi:hypothetical protein
VPIGQVVAAALDLRPQLAAVVVGVAHEIERAVEPGATAPSAIDISNLLCVLSILWRVYFFALPRQPLGTGEGVLALCHPLKA